VSKGKNFKAGQRYEELHSYSVAYNFGTQPRDVASFCRISFFEVLNLNPSKYPGHPPVEDLYKKKHMEDNYIGRK
jgi:hypothetical protein